MLNLIEFALSLKAAFANFGHKISVFLINPTIFRICAIDKMKIDLAISFFAISLIPVLAILANCRWEFGRKIFHKMYGEIDGQELRKFMILAFAYGLIIGSYWTVSALKDGYFNQKVGIDFMPKVKVISVIMLFFSMLIFGKIVDCFKKHQLFFVICSFYFCMFSSIALIDWINLPEFLIFPFNLIPGRMIGWIYYLTVESMTGILIAAVFWAFVVSTTTVNLARQGFPFIIMGGQIGGVLGTTFVKNFVHKIGHPMTIFLTTFPLILLPFVIEYLVVTTPKNLMVCDLGKDADAVSKNTEGVFGGIMLILTRPYLIGIAIVSTIFEIISTITDFQFKKLVACQYSKEMMSCYVASFGQAICIVSLLFSLFGTSFFVRRLGVRFCLLGYPLIIGLCIISIMTRPELASFFIVLVIIKAFNYALNSPVKELLYLPTSKDIKYKAKGFIDGLANKSFRAVGGLSADIIRAMTGGSNEALLYVGGIFSLGVVGFWIVTAIFLGKKYHSLVKNKEIIN